MAEEGKGLTIDEMAYAYLVQAGAINSPAAKDLLVGFAGHLDATRSARITDLERRLQVARRALESIEGEPYGTEEEPAYKLMSSIARQALTEIGASHE